MSKSPNIYLTEPRRFEHTSDIVDVVPLPHGGFSIACREVIFRPAGGGQPVDYGSVALDEKPYKVSDAMKANGKTYLMLPGLCKEPTVKSEVSQRIDGERRDRLSRLHTLQHLISAEVRRLLPNVEPNGTGISENADEAWVKLKCAEPVAACKLLQIDQKVRSNVLAELPVEIYRAKSVEHAEWQHGDLFRLDKSAKLSGKVRVVEIVGVDVNCCSGTHWESSNVGPYSMDIDINSKKGNSEATIRVELKHTWQYWYGE